VTDDAQLVAAEPVERVEHRYRRVLEGLLGIPATEGNTVDVLRNGDEIFPAMLGSIAEAQQTVDLTTYVYWTGEIAKRFAAALSERARAGVRVRVLLDAIGAHSMDSKLLNQMEAAGCEVERFRQPGDVKVAELNNRTHRKVLVCDEKVAYIGGVGIAEEWEGDARGPSEWRDTHFRLCGPAVDGLRACFVGNWAETGRVLYDERDRFPEQPQPGASIVQVVQCPSQIGWSALSTAVTALIRLSTRSLYLTSAYFVPDDRMRDALVDAAARGVDVQVLVPGSNTDKRVVQVAGEANYAALLDAGVRIWRYEPTMLHAKILTVDGIVSCVGSANFDTRSMRLNEEANLIVFDADVTERLDRDFAEDLQRSVAVDPEEWAARGPVQRVKEAVVGLIDDQL
jgi:cardiolipin synthase